MQDPDTDRRYEIEIQLGKTDESHIIRTIEYWDIEKKRYPQYDHCAVIIAEDITSRFLNVISLFNGFIPLVAIQMNAFKFGNEVGLVFTKVLDEMPLGLVEEDEEVQAVTNRDYWLDRGSDTTVKMADEILELVNNIKPGFTLKYNKFYIGLAKNGQVNNFAICRPKKNYMRLEVKLPKTTETDALIESSGIGVVVRREIYSLHEMWISLYFPSACPPESFVLLEPVRHWCDFQEESDFTNCFLYPL